MPYWLNQSPAQSLSIATYHEFNLQNCRIQGSTPGGQDLHGPVYIWKLSYRMILFWCCLAEEDIFCFLLCGYLAISVAFFNSLLDLGAVCKFGLCHSNIDCVIQKFYHIVDHISIFKKLKKKKKWKLQFPTFFGSILCF